VRPKGLGKLKKKKKMYLIGSRIRDVLACVKYFVQECSSEVLCASVLAKYFVRVRVLCTSGRCCGDWGVISVIYNIYTTGSV
jgi:hypothetical protein